MFLKISKVPFCLASPGLKISYTSGLLRCLMPLTRSMAREGRQVGLCPRGVARGQHGQVGVAGSEFAVRLGACQLHVIG